MSSLTGRMRGVGRTAPAPVIVLLAVASVQLGAAVAERLFASIGPVATVFLRITGAALLLLLLWRPSLRGHARSAYRTAALFGVTIAVMNTCFYGAIARLPLGIAVALEFAGPLSVAIGGSRSAPDVLWAALAGAGILLLSPLGGNLAIDPAGVVLALMAAACWAAYILLNQRIGREFRGGQGLALSMALAALLMVVPGIATGGARLFDFGVLALGAGVALLSTFIPFSLELVALQRLPARTFGVLMSLEPAVGALVGFVVLHEAVQPRALVAIALIVLASAGTSFFSYRR